jgi:hypothetical protein
MFKYDEDEFNMDVFLENMKKIEINILNERINDILTYQNWHDKALSRGTNYYTNYDELKYYKLEDYEEISYDSIFSHFKEIYEWFLDDEEYEKLVPKLLNVFLGNDTYEQVVNFKKIKYGKKNIHSTTKKVENQSIKKKVDAIQEQKVKEDSNQKTIPKTQTRPNLSSKNITKNSIVIDDTNINNLEIDNLKSLLLKNIDENKNYESIEILKKIFEIKNNKKINNNEDNIKLDIKNYVDKYIKNENDYNYIKTNLFLDIKNELIKYLKSSFKNNNIDNDNNYKSNEDIIKTYIENLSKNCSKCNLLKFKYNFDTDKFKRDGYKNFCKSCNK